MARFKVAVAALAAFSLLLSTGLAGALASAASSAFLAAGKDDVDFIDHTFGRYVTNSDTSSSHNAVVSLGTSSGHVTFNIRASHESVNTGPLTCVFIFNQINSGAEVSGVLQWDTGESSVKSASFNFGLQDAYFTTVFCSIPRNGGAGGTRIFGVWGS